MSSNDDFITPHHTDKDIECADDENIWRSHVFLPFFAGLSTIAYAYLLWMYFYLKTPIFNRHPTTLAIYKCLFELIFVQQYLWVPFIHKQKFYDDDHDDEPYNCNSSIFSSYLSFLCQIGLVGSELCFLVISIDLRTAYTNPFSSYKENRAYYASFIIFICLLSGIFLIGMGPDVYGKSNLGLLWIQSRRAKHSINWPKFVLYYDVAAFAFCYSLWANFRFNQDSEKGFSKTVSNRISIMKRSQSYTIGYVSYGCVVFFFEIISFIRLGGGTQKLFNSVPAYLLSFRGVWGLGVILYSNRDDCTWDLLNPFRLDLKQSVVEKVALERLTLEPHLNIALRAEILYFTTQGIMFSCREHERLAAKKRAKAALRAKMKEAKRLGLQVESLHSSNAEGSSSHVEHSGGFDRIYGSSAISAVANGGGGARGGAGAGGGKAGAESLSSAVNSSTLSEDEEDEDEDTGCRHYSFDDAESGGMRPSIAHKSIGSHGVYSAGVFDGTYAGAVDNPMRSNTEHNSSGSKGSIKASDTTTAAATGEDGGDLEAGSIQLLSITNSNKHKPQPPHGGDGSGGGGRGSAASDAVLNMAEILMKMERVKKEQDAAVSRAMEFALQDAVEEMGYSRHSYGKHQSRKFAAATSATSPAAAAAGTNRGKGTDAAVERDTISLMSREATIVQSPQQGAVLNHIPMSYTKRPGVESVRLAAPDTTTTAGGSSSELRDSDGFLLNASFNQSSMNVVPSGASTLVRRSTATGKDRFSTESGADIYDVDGIAQLDRDSELLARESSMTAEFGIRRTTESAGAYNNSSSSNNNNSNKNESHSESAGAVSFSHNQQQSGPLSRVLRLFSVERSRAMSTSSINTTTSSRGRHSSARGVVLERKPSSDNARPDQSSLDSKPQDSFTRAFKTALNNATNAANKIFSAVQKEFRFKDFTPKYFARMRQLCNLDPEEYARAFETTCKEKFSEGRSGAFMFFSSDQQCIVKTTTKSESQALDRLIPHFVRYLEVNPNSLIARFLGSHCITMYGVELYFVVMLNVFPKFSLSERYDLKGSWVNRHGNAGSRRTRREMIKKSASDYSPLYQDNDLQHQISLEPDVANCIAAQIQRDVLFLRGLSFMDYSLLIGVRRERFKVLGKEKHLKNNRSYGNSTETHSNSSSLQYSSRFTNESDVFVSPIVSHHHQLSVPPPPPPPPPAQQQEVEEHEGDEDSERLRRNSLDAFRRDSEGGMHAMFVEGPGTYYMGIIDVLQEWNLTKRMERFLKVFFKRVDGDGLSAVPPVPYSERFWRRCVLDLFENLQDDESELLVWSPDTILCSEVATCGVDESLPSEAQNAVLKDAASDALQKQQQSDGAHSLGSNSLFGKDEKRTTEHSEHSEYALSSKLSMQLQKEPDSNHTDQSAAGPEEKTEVDDV